MNTKVCRKCKQTKTVDKFHKHKGNNDGLQKECKECRRTYAQSERGKQSDRERTARYRLSVRGQKTRRAYRQSDKGRVVYQESNRQWRNSNPEKYKAHGVISYAVSVGDLPSVDTKRCIGCNSQASEYHHEDYSKPLDVIPLCRNCHVELHKGKINVLS